MYSDRVYKVIHYSSPSSLTVSFFHAGNPPKQTAATADWVFPYLVSGRLPVCVCVRTTAALVWCYL